MPDISSLGLKCGLEIHQQLATGRLFSRCPARISDEQPDFAVHRMLRASEGETGQVDTAAHHEQMKAKRFQYQGYHGLTSLVELDEEPPHPIDQQALTAAIQVAKMLNMHVLQEMHVMRKTVVDGSNTSGFQRTGLLAVGGKLIEQPVRVQTLCLEEDSAKIVSRSGSEDIYNLSRLGIPLVEIATEPDITSPEQAQEVAAELGMILRSTGKCKRGLGTIRQDCNVSIKNGARVEIKGAQDLQMIPQLVENEALRQDGLLEIKQELGKRIKEVLPPAPHHLEEVFKKTSCGLLEKGLKRKDSIIGISLPKFNGLLGKELFPGYRLGTELAGYAKAFGFGGLIHSDEDPKKYSFSDTELAAVRKKLDCKKEDAFVLLMGSADNIKDFLTFVFIPRLEHLLHGVPKEVRRANPDGTTTYMRPMPGAARMYPETDLKKVQIDSSIEPPKLLNEQEADLVKQYKIQPPYAKALLREGWNLQMFAKNYPKLSPSFIATVLLDMPKEIKKRHKRELHLEQHEDDLAKILTKADAGEIPQEAVMDALVLLAEGKQLDFSHFESLDDQAIEAVVKEVIAADPKAPMNALMGQAMARLRGKAQGKQVMALLKKLKA